MALNQVGTMPCAQVSRARGLNEVRDTLRLQVSARAAVKCACDSVPAG